jgi:hypothetical protein
MEKKHIPLPADQPGILWLELDQRSQAELRQACPPRYASQELGHQLYHHATLLFGVPENAPEVSAYLGTEVAIVAYTHAYSGDVQAVRIRPARDEHDLPDTTYGVPHITLSINEGIKPFASVAMLQAEAGSRFEEPIGPLALRGVIKFHPLNH